MVVRTILFAFSIILAQCHVGCSASEATNSATHLHPFQSPPDTGMYGYRDENGAIVIEPKFYSASEFAGNGMAMVVVGDIYEEGDHCWQKTAMINPTGQIIYSWPQQVDGDGLHAPGCDPPQEGGTVFGSVEPLFDVKFLSTPPGADVFAVPYAIYDFNKEIEDSLSQLRAFAILDGVTPVPTKLFAQRYRVIFYIGNNKKAAVDLNLFHDDSRVDVTFP